MSDILAFGTIRSKPLVSPAALKIEFPATIAERQFVEQTREIILRILYGQDSRLLLIMGPCSIHDFESTLDYAEKIRELNKKIADVFFPIMRVYYEKPRTSLGWKGVMYDPHLDGSNDINTGMRFTRRLLLALTEMQIPCAAEILDPLASLSFGDLLSWGCIGARTVSSQIHRQAASGLPFPTAFKNNPDGNIEMAVQGVVAASQPHAYIGINEEGQAAQLHSTGNPHCHIVLRGSEQKPNYDPQSISHAINLLRKESLNPALVIDCSHDNSCRNHTKQPAVFNQIVEQILSGTEEVRGLVLESHLNAGNQPIRNQGNNLNYGVSITDGCMDWKTTEELILNAVKKLKPINNPDKQRETQVAALA